MYPTPLFAAEYRWSSHAVNAHGKTGTIIRPHELYLALGASPHERHFTYRELFRNVMNKRQVHDIKETLNQELVLGREDFKETIARMTQRQVRRGMNGRPRTEKVVDEE